MEIIKRVFSRIIVNGFLTALFWITAIYIDIVFYKIPLNADFGGKFLIIFGGVMGVIIGCVSGFIIGVLNTRRYL